jgi:hypothetical protein
LAAGGTLFLTVIAAVAALGGPEDAWLKTRALWGVHPAPRIISMEGDPTRTDGTYIVTIRNPAIEDVIITGYEAKPLYVAAMTMGSNAAVTNEVEPVAAGAGMIALVTAEERKPDPCSGPRNVRLLRPLVIESKRAGALVIHPWEISCPFEVRVASDHGMSDSTNTFQVAVEEFMPVHAR